MNLSFGTIMKTQPYIYLFKELYCKLKCSLYLDVLGKLGNCKNNVYIKKKKRMKK